MSEPQRPSIGAHIHAIQPSHQSAGSAAPSSDHRVNAPLLSPMEALGAGARQGGLVFAGQGAPALPEIASLLPTDGARAWLGAARERAQETLSHKDFTWSAAFTGGFDPLGWIEGTTPTPPDTYLFSTAISQALIFTAQVLRYRRLWRDGLGAALDRGSILSLSGHSQGMMTALLASESPGGEIQQERFLDYLAYFLHQGLAMTLSFEGEGATAAGGASPMAAISGLTEDRLQEALDAFNAARPPHERVYISLFNTRTRLVLSGPAPSLTALHETLSKIGEQEQKAKRSGRFAGKPVSFTWEGLDVGGAFHCPHMARGLPLMLDAVGRLGFSVDPTRLNVEVLSPATGAPLNKVEELTRELVTAQFIRPVRWAQTLRSMIHRHPALDLLLDLGPGEGVARLSQSSLRGRGVQVLALATSRGRADLHLAGSADGSPRFADLRPRLGLLPSGDRCVVNRYTRATGDSPIILPGMTPTTVDVPIVAAAANAGHTAELAGGGQVTEAIFWRRMEELRAALRPGVEIVFNALFLDPWLWNLHLGEGRLVQRARERGLPIRGVTISAGVPELDHAVQLLMELNALGIWQNAFKPGTEAQVDQVIAIARAVPELTVFCHLEGGRAGGHHSWEDLQELLLSTWARIRSQPNLILCVGGGIATEAAATRYLTGAWSEALGEAPMPVDAVLLGTVTMACLESTASPQVKAALVAAAGTDRWVLSGERRGGVTSGRSQLGADIHYLDNAAARCGHLLDEVAGDAEAVSARREEIISALAATAKPYFGDLEAMSYAGVLDRMVELMAVGRGGAYEDGPWPDVSYRRRVLDFGQRIVRRLGTAEALAEVWQDASVLDDPHTAVAALLDAVPEAAHAILHPADVPWFIHEVCARPGKPVCFVPVIDADVRRWYKADSLWQAQDPRYEAGQVLVIPGPEAIQGIRQADEPIAELLHRFETHLLDALAVSGPEEVLDHLAPTAGALPVGFDSQRAGDSLSIRIFDPSSPDALQPFLAGLPGVVGALATAPTLFTGDRSRPNPLRRLLIAEAGAALELIHEAGLPIALTWRPEGAQPGERVEIGLGDEPDTLRLEVHTGEAPRAGALILPITAQRQRGRLTFHVTEAAYRSAVAGLYHQALFGGPIAGAPLYEEVEASAQLEEARAAAYRRLSGAPGEGPTLLNMVFSLALPAIFRALSADALVGDLLSLVHLRNQVRPGPGWPLTSDDELVARCKVVEVGASPAGRRIRTTTALRRGSRGPLCAEVIAEFMIRAPSFGAAAEGRAERHHRLSLHLASAADIDFLFSHKYIEVIDPTPEVGATLKLEASARTTTAADGRPHFQGEGRLILDQRLVATLQLDEPGHPGAIHPFEALISLLSPADAPRDTPPLTLLDEEATAPTRLGPFAEVSGDGNPIHQSVLAARLGGLPAPIVHGMWTAARLETLAARAGASLGAGEVADVDVSFLAPVSLGEGLSLRATRVGLREGGPVIQATAAAPGRPGAPPVARLTARLAPPRTAYIFPGQGIQSQGMGMDAYSRSPAARGIWDRADAFTRRSLGFSILRIVRENPRHLRLGEQELSHPEGILSLTQFTQVAMAVMARAQVEEIRAASALVEDAFLCGHSVGEYNALCAIADVLPLEAVVDIVYHRGLVMHGLVPRDSAGRSDYAMAVIRPHYAGLNHVGADALVEEIRARTGRFLQIVNYNIIDRQYSVTGHRLALDALGDALEARRRPGAREPLVRVPGVDVPFHSDLLRPGVADFRRVLEARLPRVIDYSRLVGRYIPNLHPAPFSLDPAYLEAVHARTSSPILSPLLQQPPRTNGAQAALARTLLIELLAYQFASPVRWIETQALLLTPVAAGGLGARQIVEIGAGNQPTLKNMALYTQSLTPAAGRVAILNSEADRIRLLALDRDPDPAPVIPALPAETEAAPQAPAAAAPAPAATSAPRPVDRALTVSQALKALLAIQARLRADQIGDDETIEALFDGVSSRRNQALLDLGAEFELGTIDGAADRPLSELASLLEGRARSYRAPGPYLDKAADEAIRKTFLRAGVGRRELLDHLSQRFGLGEGLQAAALVSLAQETREGQSTRGGPLGALGDTSFSCRADALTAADTLAAGLGRALGIRISPVEVAQAAVAVDGAAIAQAEARLASALKGSAQHLLDALDPPAAGTPAQAPDDELRRLAALDAELGPDLADQLAPLFDAGRHVVLDDVWARAQRAVAALFHDGAAGRLDAATLDAEVRRLARHGRGGRVAATAAHLAERCEALGLRGLAEQLRRIALGSDAPPPFERRRPRVTISAEGALVCGEDVVATDDVARLSFVEALWPADADPRISAALGGGQPIPLRPIVRGILDRALDLRGQTALITGASPGSIAWEVAGRLLWAGARVVATTTTWTPERLRRYADLYDRWAGPDAALHILPLNQASFADVDALIDWLASGGSGGSSSDTGRHAAPLLPDLILPFGAMKDSGTLDTLGPGSDAALRANLLGVERLISGLGARILAQGRPQRPAHVVLPLSPNHGAFGGDGRYAEAKAALEVLLTRVTSEADAWGAALTVAGARIGWVRGTRLMDQNDAVAPRLERDTGLITFSNQEMGALVASLCADEVRLAARGGPVRADLTGGFDKVSDLKGTVAAIREDLEARCATARRRSQLEAQERRLLAIPEPTPTPQPLPRWPGIVAPSIPPRPITWPALKADLADTIVIVGAAELGPWGSSRTRFEIEAGGALSDAGVLELAWMTGLVRYDATGAGRWIDVATKETIPEHELAETYRAPVMERCGIRPAEAKTLGFDPGSMEVLTEVFLQADLRFPVTSEAEGRAFVSADPAHTRCTWDEASDQWWVIRAPGTPIRVPRTVSLSRRILGQLPRGLSFPALGVPAELAEGIDRVAQMNLVATADAFLSAGLTPEDLLASIHPARIGNTQGGGIGGMQSLHRLYLDHVLDRERQGDSLQETLINVTAAYGVQSYTGAYGVMSNPVAACATAALSIEEAADKLRLGKADFIVAGGFDDIGSEGMVGFTDMAATADTDAAARAGLTAAQLSRPNDRRRRGFVEAQGGGSVLLTRGDVALRMGLPVLGVVAFAGSYTDGLHRSMPAPGMGALSAALGGAASPLARALLRYGLTADDVAVVYKHDTSTAANDPNESALHQGIQQALGRSPGNPLFVVSQKSLTGHPKGGAAAWQLVGLCQSLLGQLIPGNPNLECVDDAMAAHTHLAFTDRSLKAAPGAPLRAGLLTSLGFGHVSGLALVLHPAAFTAQIPAEQRAAYERRAHAAQARQQRELARIFMGQRPLFERRVHRRFTAADGSQAQAAEEAALLLDADARLDPATGRYRIADPPRSAPRPSPPPPRGSAHPLTGGLGAPMASGGERAAPPLPEREP